MDEPALTGGCGCGLVRFELTAPLVSAAYCHCSRCRRRSGTPGPASARIVPGSFQLLQGKRQLRGWAPPDGLEKVFCRACGSALLARDPDHGDVRVVRLGAIDGDPGVRPGAHQFVAYAATWETLPDDGLPRYPERAPG